MNDESYIRTQEGFEKLDPDTVLLEPNGNIIFAHSTNRLCAPSLILLTGDQYRKRCDDVLKEWELMNR